MFKLVFVFLVLVFHQGQCREKCVPKDFGFDGTVCVCNAEFCDTLPELEKPIKGSYVVYTSNRDGLRLEVNNGVLLDGEPKEDINVLKVNEEEILQEIFGFGGAFTDATGINIASLSQKAQEKLMESYFSKSGLDYNLCRVPIGGTDFSTHPYSYDDSEEEDPNLKQFSLQDEDFNYKIPYIKWAKNLTEDNLQLYASAWTAPKWMKINGNYSGMFGFLKLQMYQPWANYHLKFLEAYDEQNIQFWGITTGNEPVQALTDSKINSVAWFPWDMSRYIRENLGPILRKSKFSDIKIMMLDDMRFFMPWFTNWVMLDDFTRNYIDGIGVHWYFDDKFSPNLLDKAHESHPDKFILATEACNGDKTGDIHVTLGSWERGEKYGNSIIEDVNHWVTGWIDWNMVLDTDGGPTYIYNNVDAPIIVNATSDEFYKQPTYYVMGHFTKFLPRESRKLNNTQIDVEIPVTSFKRPDGGIVVIILNKKETEANITLTNDLIHIPLTVTPKSISTLVYYD